MDYKNSRENEELQFTIEEEENQIAVVDVHPGRVIKSETAKFIYMTDGVELNTTTGSGIGSALTRLFSGSSFFITEYTYKYDRVYGRIGIAEPYPSKMIPVRLSYYKNEIICQKGHLYVGLPTSTLKYVLRRNGLVFSAAKVLYCRN